MFKKKAQDDWSAFKLKAWIVLMTTLNNVKITMPQNVTVTNYYMNVCNEFG